MNTKTVNGVAERMRDLIKRSESYARRITDLEAQLSALKVQQRDLHFNDIPAFLVEHGMAGFKSANGDVYKLARYVGVTTLDNSRLLAWLRDNGYEDEIRSSIDISVKGYDTNSLEAWLKENGLTYNQGEKVHGMTLKALITRRIEAEESVPDGDIATVDTGLYVKVSKA